MEAEQSAQTGHGVGGMTHTKPIRESGSAAMCPHAWCGDCGWPIVDACCNDGLATTEPYNGWDWWMYCSNKTCKNHPGEGVFQNWPDWILGQFDENGKTT